jgi:hypothetical protein
MYHHQLSIRELNTKPDRTICSKTLELERSKLTK